MPDPNQPPKPTPKWSWERSRQADPVPETPRPVEPSTLASASSGPDQATQQANPQASSILRNGPAATNSASGPWEGLGGSSLAEDLRRFCAWDSADYYWWDRMVKAELLKQYPEAYKRLFEEKEEQLPIHLL
jgi:hypothetical protein